VDWFGVVYYGLPAHTPWMASVYKIINDGLKAFGVEITSPGLFLSVKGFATRILAEEWIAKQKAADAAVDAAAKTRC
jgi:hypothetical protein